MSWLLVGAAVLGYLAAYYLLPRPKIPEQKWQLPICEDGAVRPVVFGTVRLRKPNIIWFGDKQKDKDGFFSARIHYDLCHGQVDKLLRVIINDKTAWEGEVTGEDYVHASAVFDGVYGYAFHDPANGDYVSGICEFNPGTVDDTPGANDGSNATSWWRRSIATSQNLTDGKGPTYAGRSTVLCSLDLGKSPYLRPVAFDVQRIHTCDGGTSEQWYDETAEIAIGANREDDWKWLVVGPGDSTDRSGIAFDDSGWDEGPGGIGNAPVEDYHSSRDEDDKVSDPWKGYDTPPVRTQIPTGLGFTGGTWPNTWVTAGTQIWMRKDLGAMPAMPLGVMCWHDDTAELWFNGVSIDLDPVQSESDPDYAKFHSKGVIPASLIDTDGPNVVAYKVTDSGDTRPEQKPFTWLVGSVVSPSPVEPGDYIYAGIQVGPNVQDPEKMVDMNPIHVVREVLTDTIWGAGRAESRMGDSFEDAADTCYEEGLGISCEWRGAEEGGTVADFVAEVMRHAGGVLYMDRTTGKYEIKMIRNDYVVGELPVFTDDEVEAIEGAQRPAVGDLISSVSVSYRSSLAGDTATATVFEVGAIQAQGMRTSKIDYPYLTTSLNAHRAAMHDLRVGAAPYISCDATMSRHAASLQPGDAIVLDISRLGFDETVMRVRDISLGDGRSGKCKASLAEDVFYVPAPETLVVPAPYTPGTVKLGPLVAAQSKWITTRVIDPLDRGSVLCTYIGPDSEGGRFGGWEETEPGVLVRVIAGLLPAAWFDDVDPHRYKDDGYSVMVGAVVMAYFDGTHVTEFDEAHQGPWILEDTGYHFDNYGLPGQTSVNTNARLRRPTGYQFSSQYISGMTFSIRQGTAYGGKYVTLDSAIVSLGTTLMEWSVADTHDFTTAYRLLTEPQLISEAAPMDPLYMSATMAAGQTDFPDGFSMLPFALGLDAIPPGYWYFRFQGVWLDADDAGATISLGAKVWRSTSDGGEVLFEALSEDFHNTTEVPIETKAWYAGCKMDPDDVLVLILTLHTTSVGAVTMNVRYNAAARATYMLAPFKPGLGEMAMSQRVLEAAEFADGVITMAEGATTADLTLTPGDVVNALDRPNTADGDRVSFTIRGGDGVYANRILFKHQSTPVGQAKAFWIMSEANMGVTYEDLEIMGPRVRFELMFSVEDDCWHLMPGGPIG
jgi:hypothetical protein